MESALLADTLNQKISALVILEYAVVFSLFLQNAFFSFILALTLEFGGLWIKQSAASC